MSATEKIKKVFSLNTILRSVYAGLIFCAIFFNSFPAFGEKKSDSADLVFCPLQKIWVKKNSSVSRSEKPRNLLDGICSSEKEKQSFIFELTQNINFRQLTFAGKNGENLYFDFLQKGKKAFAEAAAPQNIPNREIANTGSIEKGTNSNFKKDFSRVKSGIFSLEQFARPPTFTENFSYSFIIFREMKTISRRIAPRAPPIPGSQHI